MRIKIDLAIMMMIFASAIIPAAYADEKNFYTQCLATPNESGCRAGLPAAHYQILLDEMLLNPEPNVRPVPVNDAELNRFAFRRLINGAGTAIYDGPGGQIIGAIAPGFTYVTE